MLSLSQRCKEILLVLNIVEQLYQMKWLTELYTLSAVLFLVLIQVSKDTLSMFVFLITIMLPSRTHTSPNYSFETPPLIQKVEISVPARLALEL